MLIISAAIFDPIDHRDPCHWTLHISDDSINEQYGIIDSGDHYSIGVHIGDPSASRKFVGEIPIGKIPYDTLDEVRALLTDESTVDNTSTHWNCQNWVIERAVHLYNAGKIPNPAPDFEAKLRQANAADEGNEREFKMRDEQESMDPGYV